MLNKRLLNEKRRPWGLFLLLCLAGLIFCSVSALIIGPAELKADTDVSIDGEGMLQARLGLIEDGKDCEPVPVRLGAELFPKVWQL